MKNKQATEENEQMLRQVALTINAKGISNDLKFFLSKKIEHNKNNLQYLAEMVSISGKKDLTNSVTKNNPLTQFMNHLIKEIKITDMALDIILQNLSDRENHITSDMVSKKGKAS